MPDLQCDLEGCVHNSKGFCEFNGVLELVEGACKSREIPENVCPYCGHPSAEGVCTECKSLVKQY